MNNQELKPFILLKPYFAQHTECLLQTMSETGVNIDEIYKVDDWPNLSRKVYEGTVNQLGESWRVGMEAYLLLVKSFFGSRGIVLLTECKDVEDGVRKNLELKKRVREKMIAGPSSNDIVIMMNLDRVLPPEDCANGGVNGVLGVQNHSSFSPLAQEGKWDNYYFKYLHSSDCVTDLEKEYEDLRRCGILTPANKLLKRDFTAMARLKTFLTPEDFRDAYRSI